MSHLNNTAPRPSQPDMVLATEALDVEVAVLFETSRERRLCQVQHCDFSKRTSEGKLEVTSKHIHNRVEFAVQAWHHNLTNDTAAMPE